MSDKVYCRVCRAESIKFCDLGTMPLSNNLERHSSQAAIDSERFPLELYRCKQCTLIQLSKVIDPEKLYSYYTYRSAMSMTFKKHCHDLALEIKSRHQFDSRGLFCDIAGNDCHLAIIVFKILNAYTLVVD